MSPFLSNLITSFVSAVVVAVLLKLVESILVRRKLRKQSPIIISRDPVRWRYLVGVVVVLLVSLMLQDYIKFWVRHFLNW